MSLFSGLPAILTTKAAAAAAGIGIATVAAGTAAATLSSGSHPGSNTPVTSGAPNSNGSTEGSNGGSSNGHAANASPSAGHGSDVVHAVQTCTPGPTFGECVANVASGGRAAAQGSQGSGQGTTAPPSPLPTAPVDHPTGQPSVPGAVGPPNPLPTAPVSPPSGRP